MPNNNRRDHAPQSFWFETSASAAMPTMPLIVVVPVMVIAARLGFSPGCHRHAARFAQLRIFGLHAGRDLGHVRNGISAQPHRVWCTGLTLHIGTLRIRAASTVNQCSGEDRQHANRTENLHHLLPVQKIAARRPRSNLAGRSGVVDSWYDENAARTAVLPVSVDRAGTDQRG